MAVMDDRIYHPTESLFLQKPRRHFRVGMRCEHWQLRSSIGINSTRYVYYIAGTANTQIHKLDTTTHESELVKILTFAPRCLVAKNGWISCGGENGECVAFQVDESDESRSLGTATATAPATAMGTGNDPTQIETPTSSPPVMDLHDLFDNGAARSNPILDAFRDWRSSLPDERVPLAIEGASDDTDDSMAALVPALTPALDLAPNANKNLVARSKCFGKERINCVTLWFPPTATIRKSTGAYSQSVAVLANNDKHVTVVGLESQEAMDEILYPDFVNRALISPDGQLLVAVCDDPYLYVHARVPRQGGGHVPFVRKELADFEWKLCAKVHLKSQRKEDRSEQRGSFAACFSNTGSYLAVGTQYGVISVFETDAFQRPGSEPLLSVFTTSRPKEEAGAVRDMAFCPGPFDLLAWTEHRSRVGVADIRSSYVSRQILDLNKYEDYEQIMVTEKGSIDPRLLDRNEDGELALAEPASGTSMARRMARRPTSERTAADAILSGPRNYHAPLAADETMVLEALSAHRRRRDLVNAEAAARNNSTTGTSRLLERLSNRASTHDALARSIEEGGTGPHAPHSRAIEWERARAQSERLRETAERVRARRLLDSARLLNSAEANLTTTAERAASVAAALRTLRYQDATDPNRLRWNSEVDALHQGWLGSGGGGGGGGGGGDSGTERPEEADGTAPARDRDYLASVWTTILRNRGEITADTQLPTVTTTNPRPDRRRMAERMAMQHMNRSDHVPDDTAGLTWSEDGRVLIIGAEDGVYEFHVNTFGRKFFESVDLR